MINTRLQKILFTCFYSAVIAVCYYLILFGAKTELVFSVSRLCFFVIVINLMCALTLPSDRDNVFVKSALAITLLADYFLVLNDDRTEGMLVFCFAQGFYFLRNFFSLPSKKYKLAAVLTACLTFTVIITGALIVTKSSFQPLVLYASIYFSLILTNIVFAGILFKVNLLFFIGLCLFLCCDVFVGLAGLCDILSLSWDSVLYKIAYYPFNFAWLFYVPSQALILNSMLYKNAASFPNALYKA